MPADISVNIVTLNGKFLKHGHQSQKSLQTGSLFTKLLKNIDDSKNDQLAAIRGDLKRLTPLTSIPNIAFKTVYFYSASILFKLMICYSKS